MREGFSVKLYEIMKEKSISEKDLSINIGVSEATIRNWIKGKSYPRRLKPILKLSSYLEVPVSEFR